MGYMAYAKDIFILSSILGLLLVGLVVSLKSGMVSMGKDRGRLFWNNATHLIMTLGGCVVLLLMIQQLVGVKVMTP